MHPYTCLYNNFIKLFKKKLNTKYTVTLTLYTSKHCHTKINLKYLTEITLVHKITFRVGKK